MKNSAKIWSWCKSGNVNKIAKMIEQGVNMNVFDDTGYSPLHYACGFDYHDLVKLLLNNGVDINIKNSARVTPVMTACQNRRHDIIILLLNNGADVHNKDNHDTTLMHLVCFNGYIDIMKILLEKGVDVNLEDSYGRTPLNYSMCVRDNFDIVDALLKNGACVNKKNRHCITPLHFACHMNSVCAVNLLLEHGADIFQKDHEGNLSFSMNNDEPSDILLRKEIKKRVYILSLMINYDVMKRYIVRKIVYNE